MAGCQVGTPGVGGTTQAAIDEVTSGSGTGRIITGTDASGATQSGVYEASSGSVTGNITTSVDSDGATTETGDSGGPACAIESGEIVPVAISSDMGECCGSTLIAAIDRSGLVGWELVDKVHDCSDGAAWGSNFTFSGQVHFDFEGRYLLGEIYVWNHGQAMGQRGVKDVSIETVLDGLAIPLANGPQQFMRAFECPVGAEVIVIDPPVMVESVRLHIKNSYNEGDVSNVGLGEVAFIGQPCD